MRASRAVVMKWLPVAGIWLAGLIAYANCYTGKFVLDDFTAITQNPALKQMTWQTTNWRPLARPLTTWTFAWQSTGPELSPVPFHRVNVVLHLLTATVGYWLLRELLIRSAFADRWSLSGEALAGAAAILWAVLPLNTEAVTYIVQRSEVLAAGGMLGCCLCFVYGNRAISWRGRLVWYGFALLLSIAVALSKPTAVSLPILLLSCEFAMPAQTPRRIRWGVLLLLMLPPVGIVIDTAAAGLLTSSEVMASPDSPAEHHPSAGVGTAGITSGEYLRTQMGVVGYYVWLAISLQSQSLDHGWKVADSFSAIVVPLAGWSLYFAGLIGWWFVANRRSGFCELTCATRRICLPGVALLLSSWYLALLAPTSSIIPLRDLAVEHRAYLPSLCVMMLLILFWTIAVDRCVRSVIAQRMIWSAGVVIVGLLAIVGTRARNADYQSLEQLWQQALVYCPENPRVRTYYAAALLERQADFPAIKQLERALSLYQQDPRKPQPTLTEQASLYSLLGIACGRVGRPEEAIQYLIQANTLAPNSAEIAANLGAVYQQQQQFDVAEIWYQRALSLQPHHERALLNLGRLKRQQGQLSEAITVLERACEWHPASVRLAVSLATTYEAADQLDAADAVYRRLLQSTKLDSAAWLAWGKLERRRGDYASAYEKFVQAARLAPRDVWPLVLQAEMLARLGQPREADAMASQILSRIPADSPAAKDLQRLKAAVQP
ncbi:tetratricopeptide repeat protein [bacterium]|nr:tetratricopeptide repeat protein [bacterium]